ncbi:MAG TPA: glycine zipper 2TM domain-containing protein [Candidatus Sulfotelmatobacter sp.]|nr:glycine zipper 2TM domain-containing protein [Candidatus Sulfotelmatobacter sp.]
MRIIFTAIALLLAALLAGCASAIGQGGPELGEESVRYGVITRIEPVSLEGDHQLGLGAVLGAAAGGIIGHQFGGGSGRDVATVIGAVGGGLAGNAIQNRYVDRRPGQHIFVRLDNGVTIAVTEPADPALRVGDRVRVQGRGMDARVVRG